MTTIRDVLNTISNGGKVYSLGVSYGNTRTINRDWNREVCAYAMSFSSAYIIFKKKRADFTGKYLAYFIFRDEGRNYKQYVLRSHTVSLDDCITNILRIKDNKLGVVDDKLLETQEFKDIINDMMVRNL